jgi:hypothetical protein
VVIPTAVVLPLVVTSVIVPVLAPVVAPVVVSGSPLELLVVSRSFDVLTDPPSLLLLLDSANVVIDAELTELMSRVAEGPVGSCDVVPLSVDSVPPATVSSDAQPKRINELTTTNQRLCTHSC